MSKAYISKHKADKSVHRKEKKTFLQQQQKRKERLYLDFIAS